MKRLLKILICVLLACFAIHISCKKDLVSLGELNKPPTANAGSDQIIQLPIDRVMLDGSASTDPDGNSINFHWTKIAGPVSYTIINPSLPKTDIQNLIEGSYQLELKVTDSGGLFSRDTVKVIVNGINKNSTDSMYIIGCNASLTTIGRLSRPALGGKIVSAASKVFFSWYDGNLSGTTIYDATSQTWSTSSAWVSSIQIGTKLMEATYTYPVDVQRFEIYDAATGVRNIHEVPELRAYIKHDITESKVIFAGGFNPDYTVPGASKRIDIYDYPTNSWTLLKYDSASRSTNIAAIDNKIILFGTYVRTRLDTLICGIDDDGISYCHHPSYADPKIDIYDMSTKTWSIKYLSEAKGNIRIAKTEHRLYFFQEYSTKIDVYDASSNTWKVELKNDETDWTRTHVVGNKILFTKFWSNEVGIYDMNTKTWSIRQLNKPNAQTDYLVAVAGNKILFFYVFDYEDHSTAIDTYDANTNTWCHGELSRSLVRSAIGVMNNKIYIAGGITKTNPNGVYDQFLDNIWIFDF